jgi:hypothetical protein
VIILGTSVLLNTMLCWTTVGWMLDMHAREKANRSDIIRETNGGARE